VTCTSARRRELLACYPYTGSCTWTGIFLPYRPKETLNLSRRRETS